MFNLEGYKPEAPADSEFKQFKYEGPAKVEFARLEKSTQASEYYQTPEGSNLFAVKVTTLQIPAGENMVRSIWKTWNLDTTVMSQAKVPKLPVQKLADQMFACGLEFANLEELQKCGETLVSGHWIIKARPNEKFGQMFDFKGPAPERWEEEEPAQQVAF